jgi:myosin heavy subunit
VTNELITKLEEDSKKELEEKERELSSSKKQQVEELEDLKKEFNELITKELEEKERELSSSKKQQVKALEDLKEELDGRLNAAIDSTNKLKRQLSSTKNKLSSSKTHVKKLEDLKEELDGKLNAANNNELSSSKKHVKELEDLKKELGGKLNAANDLTNEFKKQLSSTKNELSSSSKEQVKVLQDLKKELNELQDSKQTLTFRLNEASQVEDSLRKKVEDVTISKTSSENEVKSLQFKLKKADNQNQTIKKEHLATARKLLYEKDEVDRLKGVGNALDLQLQETTKALGVAKDGTTLDYAIKIKKDSNYESSKLEELAGLADVMLKRYLEDRTNNNNNDKHFPFPLEKGEHDVVSQLTNEHNIIVEIKSDQILFRSFSDLLWKTFFKNNEASYDDFLSFNGWIGEKAFDTTNLLACKVEAMNASNKNATNKRKATVSAAGVDCDKTAATASNTTANTASTTTANTASTSTTASTTDYNDNDLMWTKLSGAAKTHAKELGYSQHSWDSFESLSSFSTKQNELKPSQKLAVTFLFKGVWPPSCTKLWQHKGFESNYKVKKSDPKAGESDFIPANGRQKRTRYFLIEPNGDGTWQAYRINEKKNQADGKTCECPFCRKWFNSQGINMHMKSCCLNYTPTNQSKSNKKNKPN